jgi:hypothetical protein
MTSIMMSEAPVTFTSENAMPTNDYEKSRRHKSRYKDPFMDPDSEERRHRHKTQERAARKAKKAAEKLAAETAESRVSSIKGRRGSESVAAVPAMMDPYTPTPPNRKHNKLEQVLGVDMEAVEKEKRKHRKHEKERRGDREEDVGEGRQRKERRPSRTEEDLGSRISRKTAGILGLKNGAETVRESPRSPSRTRSPSHSRVSRSRTGDMSTEMTENPLPSTLYPISEVQESRHRRHHKDRTTEGEESQRRHKSRAPIDLTEPAEESRRRRHKFHAPVSALEEPEHRHSSKSRIRSHSRHPTDSEVANNNPIKQREDHSKRKHHVPPSSPDEPRHRHRHRDKDKDRDKKSRTKSRHPDDQTHKSAKTSSRINGPIPVTSFPISFPPEPSAQELEMSERAHVARRAERRARKTARTEDVLKDSGNSLSPDEGRMERKGRGRSKSFSTPEEQEAYRVRKELKRTRKQLPGEGIEEGYLSPVSEVRRKRTVEREREKVRTRPRRNTEPPMSAQEGGGFSLKKAISKLLTF